MNARETASVVALVAAAYPQWPASKETVAVYADALADLPFGDVADAVRRIIATEDRWPTVATIRRTVAAARGTLAPSGLQAWGEVTAAAERVGRTRVPEWSHPAVAETVRALGWWEICASTNPETLRAQFTRLYDDARTRADVAVLAEPGALLDGPGGGDRLSAGRPVAAVESGSAAGGE